MSAGAEAERKSLLGRASIVGAGTLVSRLLGLLRDMTLAAVFTRAQTDAFFVAFTIPNAMRQLLGEGAVSGAVVPVLTEKLTKDGDEAARAFFAKVRGLSLVVLAVVSVLGMLLAEPLCDLFAAGYRSRPEEFARTVSLTRVVFPYLFFVGSAALGMAALHAKRRFAVAAFAPALLNIGFLACAFACPPFFRIWGIDVAQAMAAGALLGGIMQVLAQMPALRAIGFAELPRFDLRDKDVRKVLTRLVPMTFGVGVYYLDILLSRRFLSELGEGAQSYFNWASRLCDFPQGIFVMALSTAALPSLSTFAAEGNRDELTKHWAHGMKLALFVAIPAAAGMVVLREPLVAALFQRGAFDAVAVRETARSLFWQGGAIFCVSVVRQIIPALHAMGDTRSPVIVAVVDLVVFVTVALLLRPSMGHEGVSAAVAAASTTQMILLLLRARRTLGTLRLGEVLPSCAKLVVAAGAASIGAHALISAWVWDTPVGRPVRALVLGLSFSFAYLVVARLLRSTELAELSGAVSRRLLRRRNRVT